MALSTLAARGRDRLARARRGEGLPDLNAPYADSFARHPVFALPPAAEPHRDLPPGTVFLVPYVGHAFAGVMTALRLAAEVAASGADRVTVCLYQDGGVDDGSLATFRDRACAVVDGLAQVEMCSADSRDPASLRRIPSRHTVVATVWHSAWIARALPAHRRIYLVQDDESSFYEAGLASGLADATYRFGFHHVVNSPGLGAHLQARGVQRVTSFRPTVDTTVYHPRGRIDPASFTVFFYARPGTSRNAYGLGVATIERLLALPENIRVVLAGGTTDIDHPRVENLGVLPGSAAVAEVYRRCTVGLSFMFTPHTSYQPLEYLACGVVPVTNQQGSFDWLLQHEVNSLTVLPTVDSVCDAITRLARDEPLLRSLRDAGARETFSSWHEALAPALAVWDGAR